MLFPKSLPPGSAVVSSLAAKDENGAPITWSVLEDGASAYTVTTEEQGITTVITNSNVSPSPSPSSAPTPALPQTGQEWLAVLVLGFVGMLSVPSLETELPILQETVENSLPSQPCVYSGTPYREHFSVSAAEASRKLSAIQLGSSLVFTDTILQ